MHELGIATSIFDIVRQYVPEGRAASVRRVHVRVGDLSGVMPEALEFCFSVAVEGTPYRSAVLAIEHVPMRGRCKDCGAVLSMREPVFWCPDCHSPRVLMTSGRELDVSDVELEDEKEEAEASSLQASSLQASSLQASSLQASSLQASSLHPTGGRGL